MKTTNDQTRLQFVAYLRHTLIPDFHAAASLREIGEALDKPKP